ncbi:MAG: TetR/AcrR family transcriptional regulator [Gammaproteobacteria bacterium]|nr:TetR/AcrR family transcriptional regulator [Gammaproteobacteria bacterium]
MAKRKYTSKEDIIAAVIPLFAQHGYAGVSMRDIASDVGLSPASLYNHFKDKESIYREMLDVVYKRRQGAFEFVNDKSIPPLERMERFLRGMCSSLVANPEFCKVYLRVIVDGDDERMQWLAEKASANFCAIDGLMQELLPEQDPFLLLNTLMGALIYHFAAIDYTRKLPGFREEVAAPDTFARFLGSTLDYWFKGLNAGDPYWIPEE